MEVIVNFEDIINSHGSVSRPSVAQEGNNSFNFDFQQDPVTDAGEDDIANTQCLTQLAVQIAQPLAVAPGPVARSGFQILNREDSPDSPDDVLVGRHDDLNAEDELLHRNSDGDEGAKEAQEEPSQPLPTPGCRPPQSRTRVLIQGMPSHYRSVNLEANQAQSSTDLGTQTTGSAEGEQEFVVGQTFADNEAVLYAVKCYNIRRRVRYKTQKEVWEVWKYNRPHTCVFDSILQAHPQLAWSSLTLR